MNKPRIALDSCSILHLLAETPKWKPTLDRIFQDALDRKVIIVVSEISIAEVLTLKAEDGSIAPAESAKRISAFFHHDFILRRGITKRESELAAQIIGWSECGACDALIAATAANADARILYTTDGCVNRRKRGKLRTADAVNIAPEKNMLIRCPDEYVAPDKLESFSGH